MMDEIKKGLVGQVIQDVGLVNRAGVKHIRVKLSDSEIPMLVELSDVMITLASRKPMGKALTPSPYRDKLRAG